MFNSVSILDINGFGSIGELTETVVLFPHAKVRQAVAKHNCVPSYLHMLLPFLENHEMEIGSGQWETSKTRTTIEI